MKPTHTNNDPILALGFVLAISMFLFISLMTSCSDDTTDVQPDETGEYGQTPGEYIDWLDNNEVDYYLDQFGNPYQSGELMVKFDNGFDLQKMEDLINELAVLNDVTTDDIIVNNCGCGTEDFVLLQYEQKLDGNLEPVHGSMGDPDGDDDGLSAGTSAGISTSNNYYFTPLPENLNGAGDLPVNFGPPDEGVGQGFLANDDRITIAILDSGLDFDHPGLTMYDNFRLWAPHPDDCYELGYDFVNDIPLAIDNLGHGTQVAGVILETLRAYDVPVSLMPLRISNDEGAVTIWDMFCATSFAVSHGADIVNISAGWYGGPNPILQKLIQDNPDVLFVCSAGNEGTNTDIIENGHFPSGYTYFPNVIAVGALNETNSALADFSNFGPNSISIAAPGTETTTLTPCDGQMCDDPVISVSGTSFSAPYVAAVAAAVLHCTTIPASEVRFKLYDFGIALPSVAGQLQSGKIIDIHTIIPLEPCEI